jgi:hypothetical protein
MRHFRTTIDVEASTARVWEVMVDVERWHGWTASIRSVRLLGPGLLGGLLGWMTGRIPQRYLGVEAAGLKTRSENPHE